MKDFIETSVGSSSAAVEIDRIKFIETKEANVEKITVLDVMNATSSNDAVAKLVKIWENKNAQRAVRGAALSTMALSLAACGGSSSEPEAAAPAAPEAPAAPVVGVILNATTGADLFSPNAATAANKTTANNDTIFARTNDSLNNGDVIDGGDGTDTLSAFIATAGTILPTLTAVEVIDVTNTSTGAAGGVYTLNLANSAGYSSVTFSDTADTAADTHNVTNIAAGTQVGIDNSEGAAHIYTFSFAALTGTGDGVTLNTTSIGTATGVVTITDATATATADTGAETVTIVNTAAASTLGSLAVTDAGGASMNTLFVNASAALTINGSIDFEGTTAGTINASGSTAAVTVTATGGEAITFTGGTGNDVVVTGAGNDSITGGAGNDTATIGTGIDTVVGGAGNDVVVVADAAIVLSGGSADSIDLGEGTLDEIRFTDVTTINDAGVTVTAAQLAAIAGLEVIGSSAAVTAIDANYFTQNVFNLSGNLTAAVTAGDLETGDQLILSGNGISGVNGNALTLTGALPGQNVSLVLDNADMQVTDVNVNTALTVTANIGVLTIVSQNSGTGTAVNTLDHANITAATHTINNAGVGSFLAEGGSALTISSGLTAGFTNAVNFDASKLTGALIIEGSAAADVIKGGSAADTINGNGGNDVLSGNGGNDTFQYTLGDNTVVQSDVSFERITDFAAGDIIDLTDAALTVDAAPAAAAATVAQVNAEGFATFHATDDTLAEKIIAVAKGFDAQGDFAIFEHGGNTYVSISGDGNATIDAADLLIQLDGVTGLSDTTLTAGNLTIA